MIPTEAPTVFVSSLAWSDRNAIGVQMAEFAAAFHEAVYHCYWDTSTGLSTRAPSLYLESTWAARLPFQTGRGIIRRLEVRTRLNAWNADKLKPSRRRQLRHRLGHVRFALVAPLSCRDVRRTLDVLDVLAVPYAVQLWDVLDSDALRRPSAEYRQLLTGAQHVFCLSDQLLRDSQAIMKTPASVVSFTRPDTSRRAQPAEGRPLRIALIGHLHPYRDGLLLLADALAEAKAHRNSVSISYIGPNDQAAALPDSLRTLTTAHGFVDAERRDQLLAQCHVAFCPGPLHNPTDARSRYSIPSRMADYFAVGLPVIGAVHPESAVATQYSTSPRAPLRACQSAADIHRALSENSDTARWRDASEAARLHFEWRMRRDVVLKEFEECLAKFQSPQRL
jgi:hypothetical protein